MDNCELQTKRNEEFVIVRVVKALHQVGEYGEFREDLNDFGRDDELRVN